MHPEGSEPFDAILAFNAKAGCINAIRADGRSRIVAEALTVVTRVRRCKRQCTISGGPENKVLKVVLATVADAQDLFGELTGAGTVWQLKGRDLAAPAVVLTRCAAEPSGGSAPSSGSDAERAIAKIAEA
jgi:hypothetical protein